MTEEYLSTRQVQFRLNVDRTTIYRMLNDGRLQGVKIGRQWRFPPQQIDALLAGVHPTQTNPTDNQEQLISSDLQSLQDVLAEVLAMSLQGVSVTGEKLTVISNACRFCRLVQESDSGARACRAQWVRMAGSPPDNSFSTCHAGLQYAQAPIINNGAAIGKLFAGQFLLQTPDSRTLSQTIDRLASRHNLDNRLLEEAAADLTVLPLEQRTLIWGWLEKIAASFSKYSRKQLALNHRLRQIAQMCELSL